jgi:hypothetical protein
LFIGLSMRLGWWIWTFRGRTVVGFDRWIEG